MVELVVAMTVLAIGIIGVIGVLDSSFGVVVRNDNRSRAVSLATREVEGLRATPYSSLPVPPSNETETTTETMGGRTYTIEKAVTWVTRGAATQAYKEATVVVSWNEGTGALSEVHQSTYLYPGGLGVPSTTVPVGNCGTPAAPTTVVAAVPLELAGTTGVDLAWVPALISTPTVRSWVVEYSPDNFTHVQRATSALPVSSASLRLTGLSGGTTYQFRVASMAACGALSVWSPTATATTGTSVTAGCTYGTMSIAPNEVGLQAGGRRLTTAPTVSVNTHGSCAGLRIVYRRSSLAVDQTVLMVTASPGVWVAEIPNPTGGTWDAGMHHVTLFDAATTEKGTGQFTVCAVGTSC